MPPSSTLRPSPAASGGGGRSRSSGSAKQPRVPRGRQASTLQPARHEGAGASCREKGSKREEAIGGGGALGKVFHAALSGEEDLDEDAARPVEERGEAAAEALPPTVPAPEEALEEEEEDHYVAPSDATELQTQTVESVATREGSRESLPEPQYIGLEAEPQPSEAGSRHSTGRRLSAGSSSNLPSARKAAEAARRKTLPGGNAQQSRELAMQLKSRDEEIARLRQQLRQSKQECLRLRRQATPAAGPAAPGVAAAAADAAPPASPTAAAGGAPASGGRGGARTSPGRQRRSLASGQAVPTPRTSSPSGEGRRSAARRQPASSLAGPCARAQLGPRAAWPQDQPPVDVETARIVCEEDELNDWAAARSSQAPCAPRSASGREEVASTQRQPASVAPRQAAVVAPPGGAAATTNMVAAIGGSGSNACTVRSVQDMLSATWDGSTPLAPAPGLSGVRTAGSMAAKECPQQPSPQPLSPQPPPARSASASPLPRASARSEGVVVWRGNGATHYPAPDVMAAAAPARVVVQRQTLQQAPPVPFNTPVRAVTGPQAAGAWPCQAGGVGSAPAREVAPSASPVLGLRMSLGVDSATLSPPLGTRSLAKRLPAQRLVAGDPHRGLQQVLPRPASLEGFATAQAHQYVQGRGS